MRRASAAALAAAVVVIAGCSGGEAAPTEGAETSSATAGAYADEFGEAFQETYAAEVTAGDDDYAAVTADWAAFVATLEDLEPPTEDATAHERTLAGFRAYVEAREEATDACDESPGQGGACLDAVSEATDQWMATLDRADELSGVNIQSLLSAARIDARD